MGGCVGVWQQILVNILYLSYFLTFTIFLCKANETKKTELYRKFNAANLSYASNLYI